MGTVSEITDTNQNIVESYKYDAFGKLETPPQTGNPYTYTGREYDSESGLYYYRARYYDPSIGRFLTQDPIAYKGKAYLYAYVEDNPINLIDPQGLYCERILSIPVGRHKEVKEDITKGLWILTYAGVEFADALIFWGNLICKWQREVKIHRMITVYTTWWNLDFCCECDMFGLVCGFRTYKDVTVEEFEEAFSKIEYATTGGITMIEALPTLRCLTSYKPSY